MTAVQKIILLVEDDPAHAQLAVRVLERSPELDVRVVESIAQARALLSHQHVDLVLSDLRLPDGSGLDLLETGVPLVVQTSQGDEGRAVAAMKGGALDYCVKSPEMFRQLPLIIERALNAGHNLFERRRIERELRESDERFRQLTSTIPEVFWLYDFVAGEVVYASPAWATVYGDGERSWEGRLARVHPEDREPLWAVAPSPGREFRVQDGAALRWVEERLFELPDAAGVPFRMACLAVDVTRRHELEASLRHAQKMQAVGQLSGGLAHDFNNMLAAIMSSAEELAMNPRSPAETELCQLIIQASSRAGELTRNLLSYSRKGKMTNTRVDVHDVVRETVALLTRSVDRRVTVAVALGAPESIVMGDASQLQSALLNLGINARDAMPQGGEVSFATRVVELSEEFCSASPFALTPGRFVELRVRDTGTGIAPEVLPRIFEPFFTSKDPGRGTGLGLAAVYGTMEEHRGAVTVQSTLAQGTEFTLLFPLAAAAQVTVPSRATPSGRGLVLLIDDEPLVQRAGTRVLQSLGYEVVTASDGEEAWARFIECRARLAAVICDVVLPKVSGVDVVLRIRAEAPSLPCLLCSGYAHDARRELQALPVRVLPKPFRRAELAQVLAEALRGTP